MAKKRVLGSRGARGPRGPRGPQGQRGEKGDTGAHGPPHENGDRLETARAVIEELQQAVERLRADSDTQLRRTADLQAQLDVTLGEFRHLQEQPGAGAASLRKRN